MSDALPVSTEITVYYIGPEGYGEQARLSGDFDAVVAQRGILVGALAVNNSKPQLRDREPVIPQKPAAPQQGFAPRQAQVAPGGAAVGRIHQACGNPMQFVQAGVSQAGRAYPAFFKCVSGCVNPSNGRQHTENA